jgi:hypothetical protein
MIAQILFGSHLRFKSQYRFLDIKPINNPFNFLKSPLK